MNWFEFGTQLARRWKPLAAATVALVPLTATPVMAQAIAPDWANRILAQVHLAQASPPTELQSALDDMLTAANEQDLDAIMALYGEKFEHGDGLTLDEVSASITKFWDTHSELDYQATIESWEETATGFSATILTDVTGTQASERGDFALEASSTVLNQYADDNGDLILVSQAVLKESSRLQSGDEPPIVTVNIPSSVSVGAEFDVEAIVGEPLGESLLLGAALEEPINSETYLDSSLVPLQPLQAGGIFRRADAPDRPGAEWISVMLVSDSGILIESRRLNFVIGAAE
ncbi:MAG: hypothetical protein AAF974_05600 [Cyanobacteria bacterium P01_E01_bin.34]